MSPDGRTAACRQCLKERDAKRYPKEREKRNEWSKQYFKTSKGKRVVDRSRRKWQEQNVLKRAAHIIVGNAVRDGKLIKQSCEKCGAMKVHAHHDDYTKPLTVRWLCTMHHAEVHRA